MGCDVALTFDARNSSVIDADDLFDDVLTFFSIVVIRVFRREIDNSDENLSDVSENKIEIQSIVKKLDYFLKESCGVLMF